MRIPFNKPFTTGRELDYVTRAVQSGTIAADGPFTRSCSRLLERRYDIGRVLMTPSCTAALEMAGLLFDLKPDDEVILPSFTFASTANAVVRYGARPVFVDIRPDTLNIDESLIEAAITPKTKAVYVVHYAGVACEMDTIAGVTRANGLFLAEDAAQAVNSFYKGKALGGIGQLGAYSFHHTKSYFCGEGGALCLTEPDLFERAEIIRERGTNRKKFLRGEIDKYTWVEIGSSFLPNEIACAFLLAQLESIDLITEKRRSIYEFYREELRPLEEEGLLIRPCIPDGCQGNYHSFHVLLPDCQLRDAAIAYLRDRDIQATFHYVPLHSSPMGLRFGYTSGQLGVTEDVSSRLLRLPFYYEITREEQAEVVRNITEFLQRRGARSAR